MADDKQDAVHSSSDGGVVGRHPAADQFQFFAAPATGSEFNTAHLRLLPVACFRVDDVRFKFDSSFVLPGVQSEIGAFADLRQNDPRVKGAPISIFGHSDPTYQGNFELGSPTAQSGDDYNKTLSGRRAIAIYALLVRDAFAQAVEHAAEDVADVGLDVDALRGVEGQIVECHRYRSFLM